MQTAVQAKSDLHLLMVRHVLKQDHQIEMNKLYEHKQMLAHQSLPANKCTRASDNVLEAPLGCEFRVRP